MSEFIQSHGRSLSRDWKNYLPVGLYSQSSQKQEQVATLTTEIASIQKTIEEQKNTLKEKKAELKKSQKELTKLEAKKAAADQKAAEKAKKAEAESVVKKLLASGMSADEILEKLK